MKNKVIALIMAVILILAMTSCQNAAPESAKAYEGGVLKIALSSSSPFSGMFNMVYTSDMLDAEIAYWMTEPLLSIDDNLTFDQDGAATYTYDKDAKTMTLTMKQGVKWHDGEPVTMEDLVFAYEVLANPDYEGYFFTETLAYITGIGAYKDGTSDSISGMVLSEDKNTLTIQFDKFMPSILEGGIWTYPIPKHQLGGIAVSALAADERSRSQTLGFGPFKIESVVAGETVTLTRFDDYWQGKPALDGVTLTVVNPDMVPSAMERGEYDISAFPASAYAEYPNPTNYGYMSEPDRWYQFTGFNLGHYDFENGVSIMDTDAKMSNLSLRQAIGHAVDLEAICKDFYNGLRGLNPTVLPPAYGTYINSDVKGYPYNPEKAKELLEQAGYKDTDGDGLREDPAGNPFVINWGVPNNNDETVVQFKMQCWRDVGLNVQLVSGNMMDVNAFYDMLFGGGTEIDMFEAGWIIETSPNLPGAWGRNSLANLTRFTSDEMDRLLEDLDSEAAWDQTYRIQAYKNFQEYFYKESPAIPTVWRSSLYAVNNRVKNYTLTPVQVACRRYLIELTQEAPAVK